MMNPPELDPEKLTISQLKSKLSAAGVELPTTGQAKHAYVELYRNHILGQKAPPPSVAPSQQQQPSSSTLPTTTTTAIPVTATSTLATPSALPTTSGVGTMRSRQSRGGLKRPRATADSLTTTTAAAPTTATATEPIDEDLAAQIRVKKSRPDTSSSSSSSAAAAATAPVVQNAPTSEPLPFSLAPSHNNHNNIPATAAAPSAMPFPDPNTSLSSHYSSVTSTATTISTATEGIQLMTSVPSQTVKTTMTQRKSLASAKVGAPLAPTTTTGQPSTSITTAARRTTMGGPFYPASPIIHPQLLTELRYNTPSAPITTTTSSSTSSNSNSGSGTDVVPLTPAIPASSVSTQPMLSPSELSFMSPSRQSFLSSPRSPSTPAKQPQSFTCQLLTNTLKVLGWILFGIGIWLAILRLWWPLSPTYYCDSEGADAIAIGDDARPCQRCPNHGYCALGKLIQCEENYIMKGNICIENEEIANTALAAVVLIQNHLSHKAGRFVCGEEDHLGETLIDIKALLEQSPTITFQSESMFQASLERALAYIRDSSHFNITTVEIEVAQLTPPDGANVSLAKWPPAVMYDPRTNESVQAAIRATTRTIVLYSRGPVLPFVCRLKHKAIENLLYINACAVLLIIIFAGNVWKNRVQTRNRQVTQLVKEVSSRLRRYGPAGSTVVHLRDELREFHENNRDINVLKLWPFVEERIREDTRISEGVGDSHEPVWQWIAPIDNLTTPQRLTFSPNGTTSPTPKF